MELDRTLIAHAPAAGKAPAEKACGLFAERALFLKEPHLGLLMGWTFGWDELRISLTLTSMSVSFVPPPA